MLKVEKQKEQKITNPFKKYKAILLYVFCSLTGRVYRIDAH